MEDLASVLGEIRENLAKLNSKMDVLTSNGNECISDVVNSINELKKKKINILENTERVNDDFTFDSTTGSITGYTGKANIVIIPSEIEMIKVTSIGIYAFSDCTLTSVTIPNSVTSIEEGAFDGCNSLTSIIMPNSVISIGDYAFQGCSSLTSVIISNKVTSMGRYVFEECSNLKSIKIPNSVTSISYASFQECSALTSVIIPDSVTSIDDSAFYNCISLKNIKIPNSVTCIHPYAFNGCEDLKIQCSFNSYAKEYAEINNIPIRELKI